MLSTNNLRQKKKERACADLENCFVKARRDITVGAVEAYGTAVFYDQGKIWSKYNSYEQAKHRQNAGFGIEWTVDTASLFQVPLKIEVAYPINDREYQKPQFIFLGVLTGS